MSTGAVVRFHVEPSWSMDRAQVLVRVVLLVALGAMGFSSVYWVAYLALPAIAALLISQKGGERYLREDAPTVLRVLRWLAGAYAYVWLLTDSLPRTEPGGPVDLELETSGTPSPSSALLRLFESFPALVVLALMSIAASLLWIVGAIGILISGRAPAFATELISATLRYQFRLLAYHLSLVDRYPSFEEEARPHVLGPGAT